MSGPIKYHGGKAPLAARIVALMPPHTHYVEPFAGGMSVLLAHPGEGRSEVANDLDEDLSNFWQCLANGLAFGIMKRTLEATPFSEAAWKDPEAWFRSSPGAPVDRAICFFVKCRMSMAGRMDSFTPISRARTRRGMNEQVSGWLTAIEGLPEVHARLKRVLILNRPALDCIRTQDGPGTLFYCDPPYYPDTRSSPMVYKHEMTAADHAALLDALIACKGKVMLSGYRNPLYDERLKDWTRHTFDVANHASSGSEKPRKQETLWCNFSPSSGA